MKQGHPTPILATLPARSLGADLSVSALGFGAMGMSEFYGPADDAASLQVLHNAVDAGVSMIDTADIYGRGHNEQLIGKLLRERPVDRAAGKIKVATKCGIERPADAAYARRINTSPAYVRHCCEESLKRLGVERIDLFYLHRVDPDADIGVTMDCLSQLVREGKIAHIGLCEVSTATLRRAHAQHPIAALQTEYSLWSRDVEAELLPATRELNIGLVAYSPLGRGFLTGRLHTTADLADTDFRRTNPRFQDENLAHNLNLLDTLRTLAAERGATSAQIALAWLLGQGSNVVPIPGTRHSSYLNENLQALRIALTDAEMARLSESIPPKHVQGERYTVEGMKGIGA